MARPKFHDLKVKQIRRETEDCISVNFEVPNQLALDYQYLPGQYLTLRTTIHGEDVRRSYSICSMPGDGELRVAIKELAGGVFSSWVARELKAGDSLQVMTPTGNFTTEISAETKKNFLFLAAGSGITPVISIIKSVLAASSGSEVTLIYGNRFFNSIIFREELENLKDEYLGKFRVFHVLSGEPNEIPMFHGRIDAEKLEAFSTSFVNFSELDEIFLCGPAEMIHAGKSFAEAKGVPADHIHFELFFTPGKDAPPPTTSKVVKAAATTKGEVCSVSVIFDGQQTNFTMPFDGEAVLDAAQREGLDIPFSCKGGMCCTCKAKIIEGEVEMDVNYALEPGEVEAGFVLTCQSHPRSNRLVVDYDANN